MKRIFAVLLALALTGCSFGGGGGAIDSEPAEDSRLDYEPITRFENGVITIDAEQRDGTKVLLSTQLDAQSTAPWPSDLPGHAGRSWTLLQTLSDETFMGYVVASWDREDPGDYLTAGWWVHFAGQRYPDIDPYHKDNTNYLFIDGPELNPDFQPPLPETGTASYSGGTGGIYLYKYGSGDLKDKISSEEYAGTITLTADFSASTIQGCVGCAGDISVQRLHLASAFERFEPEKVELRAPPTDYEIRFAPAEFNPDGTFETREGVTITHLGREIQSIPYGYWGGGFSNRRDAAGNPRLVAGFNQVFFIERDGSIGMFAGIFNALSEDFRK